MRNPVRSALGVSPAGATAPIVAAAAPQLAAPVVEAALERFAVSMQEYAVHLQSHTAVMMNLREVTASLQQSVEAQSRLLMRLEGALPPPAEKGLEHPSAGESEGAGSRARQDPGKDRPQTRVVTT